MSMLASCPNAISFDLKQVYLRGSYSFERVLWFERVSPLVDPAPFVLGCLGPPAVLGCVRSPPLVTSSACDVFGWWVFCGVSGALGWVFLL